MTVGASEDSTMQISKGVKQKCLHYMKLFSVPENIKDLCIQLLEFEYMVSSSTLKFKDTFREDFEIDQSNATAAITFIQSALKKSLSNFREWNSTLERHHNTISNLPLIKIYTPPKTFKAPCFLRNREFEVQEGEMMQVVDVSEDNIIKVKLENGKEGSIPLMSLILPTSDSSLQALLERLQIQLLCGWFDCFKLFYSNLYNCLYTLLIKLKYKCPSLPARSSGPRSCRDLKILRKLMKRLEVDYLNEVQLAEVGVVVATEDVAVVRLLCDTYKDYQVFEKLFKILRSRMESKARPICMYDKLSEFKTQSLPSKPVKYHKTKMVVESVEIFEEILHYPNDIQSTTSSTFSNCERTKVESERMTSSSQEVKQRFVIRSIKDPSDGTEISLDTAVDKGILDMSRGLYLNPLTGESKPIGTAMSQGLIKVEAVTEVASKAKVENYGMMTVRSLIEDPDAKDEREFKILSLIDPLTAEKLTEQEACDRGWLSGGWEGGEWVNGERVSAKWVGGGVFKLTGDQSLKLHEAVDEGWIKAEVTNKERLAELECHANYEAKSYLIKSVMNARNGRWVSFNEAMRFGMLDVESGCYIDRTTDERIMVDEALKRGFIKGRLVKEGDGSAIDPVNKVVAKNLKSLQTAASAVSAFRKNAGIDDVGDGKGGDADGGVNDGGGVNGRYDGGLIGEHHKNEAISKEASKMVTSKSETTADVSNELNGKEMKASPSSNNQLNGVSHGSSKALTGAVTETITEFVTNVKKEETKSFDSTFQSSTTISAANLITSATASDSTYVTAASAPLTAATITASTTSSGNIDKLAVTNKVVDVVADKVAEAPSKNQKKKNKKKK